MNPLAADELLYRRLPANPNYRNPATGFPLELAFQPTPADTDGLSLSRERVGPAGAAATGRADREFFVATLRVADLTALGLTVVPDRDDHVVITDLTHDRRQSRDPATKEQLAAIYGRLVQAVIDVAGPFPGHAPPPPTSPPSPA